MRKDRKTSKRAEARRVRAIKTAEMMNQVGAKVSLTEPAAAARMRRWLHLDGYSDPNGRALTPSEIAVARHQNGERETPYYID